MSFFDFYVEVSRCFDPFNESGENHVRRQDKPQRTV